MDKCYSSTIITNTSDFPYFAKITKIIVFHIYLFIYNKNFMLSDVNSGQENRINDRGDPLRWPRDAL
jgi:hypothetical protein